MSDDKKKNNKSVCDSILDNPAVKTAKETVCTVAGKVKEKIDAIEKDENSAGAKVVKVVKEYVEKGVEMASGYFDGAGDDDKPKKPKKPKKAEKPKATDKPEKEKT